MFKTGYQAVRNQNRGVGMAGIFELFRLTVKWFSSSIQRIALAETIFTHAWELHSCFRARQYPVREHS